MEDENDNIVPESTAADHNLGAPSLDADSVDAATHDTIDSLLDEAESESDPNYERNIAPEEPEQIEQPEESEPEQPEEVIPQYAEAQQQQPVVQEPQIDLDPEIAAIEKPRNMSEKNQNNWRKLQETASTYKQQAMEAEQLRQRLYEYEQGKVNLPEDYEELKTFRRIFDIASDPQFKSDYEAPISAAKENIYNILRQNGASDDVIASIERAGGPEKVDQSWWKSNAIDKLQWTEAESLKKSLIDVMDLRKRQEQEVGQIAQNAEQYLMQKENEKINWYKTETQQIDQTINEITKDIPWARFIQPSQNATDEQIQRIQAHNARVGDLAGKFNSALWPKTAQERANVAAAAVFSHVLTEQLQSEQSSKAQLEQQVARLTAENNKLKGASRIPKSNVTSPSSIKSNSLSDRIKMPSSDAIDLGLDEAGA
jgi:hypothetical protein